MKNQIDFFGRDLSTDGTLQNSWGLYTMSLLGLGEIFGGQLVGLVKDKVGKKAAIFL